MLFDFEVNFVTLLIIFISVISQSIFGVGVLLWGTPLLMLVGLPYFEVLALLLPISLAISLIQVSFSDYKPSINTTIKVLSLCITALVFSLGFVLISELDPMLFVIFALFLSGILRLVSSEYLISIITKYKDGFLPLIGFVHGASNLGGSLLVVWASLQGKNKIQVRTYISYVYAVLAFVQLALLILAGQVVSLSISYFGFVIPIYIATQKHIFRQISEGFFQSLITGLIFAMVILLSLSYLGFWSKA